MQIPYQAKIPSKNHNVSTESLIAKSFQIILSLIIFILISIVFVYLSLGIIISFAPINFGKILGESFAKNFQAESKSVPYQQEEQIQNIFAKLKNVDPQLQSLELRIINSNDLVNAFALPGGIIIIGTGLLEELKSEQEIAMILGHEIGHQVNRDYLQRLSKSALILVIYSAITVGGSEVPIASSLNDLLDLSFSRRQELNADQFGLELLNKVYHSSFGAVEAFQSILQIENKLSTNHKFLDLNILKTHPDTKYRIKKLSEKVAK